MSKRRFPTFAFSIPMARAFLCHLEKPFRLFIHFAHRKGDRGISEIPIEIDAHIDAHDIPFLQFSLTGDSVDHLFVDGDTEGSRKSPVAFKGRDGLPWTGYTLLPSGPTPRW